MPAHDEAPLTHRLDGSPRRFRRQRSIALDVTLAGKEGQNGAITCGGASIGAAEA